MSFTLSILTTSIALTVNILAILFGAMTLLNVMQQSKKDKQILSSLKSIKQGKELKGLTIALILVSFFEGAAGFGVPGILVPIILVSLGLKPLTAICTVLFIDAIVVIHGAIGTPIYAGIQGVIQSNPTQLTSIAVYSSIFSCIAAILLTKQIINPIIKREKMHAIVDYALFILIFLTSSYFYSQISAIISALLLTAVLLTTQKRTKNWKKHLPGWLPYIILTLLIVIPKYIPGITHILNHSIEIGFTHIKPFTNPIFAFAITASIVAGYYKANLKEAATQCLSKIKKVTPLLFISLLITQILIHSEALQYITKGTQQLGEYYLIIIPLLGALGSALTGSATVSNILLAASHNEIALNSHIPQNIILALQNSGAGLGNAISIFNIIAACSIFHEVKPKQVFKITLIPILTVSLIVGIIGWGYLKITVS